MNRHVGITALPLAELPETLGATATAPLASRHSLAEWRMERDDAPIFSYLYRVYQPRRHLEFGTWQGFGTCLCLEACGATVWTINLPDGETMSDGSWAYSERVSTGADSPPGAVAVNFGQDEQGPRTYHRTDASSYIGRFYREKGLGHRVCQVYCDSRRWDHTAFPKDFFDSALIDGGHESEIVISDTRKALQVLRPGGMLLWHDFCPDLEIRRQFASARGVTSAIEELLPELQTALSTLVWINPSWILLGIKK